MHDYTHRYRHKELIEHPNPCPKMQSLDFSIHLQENLKENSNDLDWWLK